MQNDEIEFRKIPRQQFFERSLVKANVSNRKGARPLLTRSDAYGIEVARVKLSRRKSCSVDEAREPGTATKLEIGEGLAELAGRSTVQSGNVVQPYGRQLAKKCRG